MAISTICVALSLFLTCTISTTLTTAQSGFSVGIYHRDSPASPFYDPKLTLTDRIRRSITRSIFHANHFSLDSESGSPKADIFASRGEYLMNISLGTPAFPIVAIADTGSDPIWTQCAPCEDCFKQKQPLFDPKKSKTCGKLPCDSSSCPSSCSSCTDDNSCDYSLRYGDGSYSNGVVATETITLKSTSGRPVHLPKYMFGCGFESKGTFRDDASGIIGLGGGDESLVSQLDSLIDGKFSYCLIPVALGSSQDSQGDGISMINFGKNAVVSGHGVVKTPIVEKSPKTFYYLTLEGLTVSDEKVEFTGSSSGETEEGNIIIDSGTTLVILPSDFYSSFEAAVSKQVNATSMPDPTDTLSLCYSDEDGSFQAPSITANFAGGDLKLNSYNTFVPITEGVVCLAFRPSDELSIWGNLAQMNFLVGYDKVGKTVSFKPADCTKL